LSHACSPQILDLADIDNIKVPRKPSCLRSAEASSYASMRRTRSKDALLVPARCASTFHFKVLRLLSSAFARDVCFDSTLSQMLPWSKIRRHCSIIAWTYQIPLMNPEAPLPSGRLGKTLQREYVESASASCIPTHNG
jgi:hypothetical protein